MKNWRQWAVPLAGAGLVAWAAGAAAADEPVRQTRSIAQPFSEVRLAGNFDLELTQADAVSLAIEAAREELPAIRSDVDNGVLTVRRADVGFMNFRRWFSHPPAARVFLSVKAIDRVILDGSGNIHVGAWTHHVLEVRIAGAGNARIDRLTAARFTCDLAGSGDVFAAGAAADQRIRISGSGRYLAPDLKSQTAGVSINGSGEVELWAERTLDVHIAGSGDVRYYGTPAVTQSVSGSGSVASLGPKSAP